MEQLDLTQYINRVTGDQLTADMWNNVFTDISTKVNEVIEDVAKKANITDIPSTPDSSDNPTTETKVNSTNLFINDTLYTDSTITLAAGASYKIEGTLTGQIIIDAESAKPEDDTFIRLNGVTITTDQDSAIIYKTPENNTGYKGLTIVLGRDSINTVVSTAVHERADSQPGAIYSMNNLAILGTGYLNIICKGGHGIKASELRLGGPHIWVEAIHDAIHGSKLIIIDDGYYYITKGNDAFGTGTEGKIYVLGGHFTAFNLGQVIFNAKNGGYYLETPDVDSEYKLGDKMAKLTWEEGKVEESDDESTYTPVTAVEGIYTLTKKYCQITGKINGRIVSPATNSAGEAFEKVDVVLNGAYIESSSNGATINYLATSSRLKIKTSKDTINVIKNLDAELGEYDTDAVKSENNVSIELKSNSYLSISSTTGDGIDGGSVLITDGSGTLVASNCGGRGIKGNVIVIGPNCESAKSVITSYYTDPTDTDNYSTFDGVVIAKNNHEFQELDMTSEDTAKASGFADIFARNGKASKGQFGTTDTELRGVVLTGALTAAVSIDTNKADNIYASLIKTPVSSCTYTNRIPVTSELYYVMPVNKLPVTIN